MFVFEKEEHWYHNLYDLVVMIPWWGWAPIATALIVWLTAKPAKHAWRIRKASRVLDTFARIGLEQGPAAQFGYLRSKSVDPYTFEEAILTALLEKGAKIRRNLRYTGDGGIDGQAWVKGKRILVQAKLYKNHINPAHVEEFARLCQKKKCLGLFVHSGKTGPASRKHTAELLDIVSGDRLIKLLTKGNITLFPFSHQLDL